MSLRQINFFIRIMRYVEKNEYRFEYKGIHCEIVFWTNENMKNVEHIELYKSGGIWNSYIIISKDDNPELYKKYNLTGKKYKISEHSPERIIYDYYKLDINMSGGITFYEKGEINKRKYIKIGNDYNHSWNNGMEDQKTIKLDIENTIDEIFNK